MRYVLYITEDYLTIYPEKFTPDEPFLCYSRNKEKKEIDQFLIQLSIKDEVSVVLDLIDEELNFEWVPKVMPWERSSLLKRKMTRLQTDHVALAEIKQGLATRVTKDGRKEELMLSAAVSNHLGLDNFFAKLERSNALLLEIYSKAFLIKHFFEYSASQLNLPAKYDKFPLLITSRQEHHSYRQTFIFDGNLRLSRLVELDKNLASAKERQNALLDETRMAISYIYNQKILEFKTPLALLFLDSDQEVLEGLQELAITKQLIANDWNPEAYFFQTARFQDLMTNRAFCELAGEPLSCFSPVAMADYVLQTRPKGFYRNAYVQKVHQVLLGRKLFIATNLLLFLGMIGYVTMSSIHSYLKWQEIGMLDERIIAHEAEKRRLESLVQLNDDAQTIKSSVEFSESILTLKLGKLAGFDIQLLSEALVKYPNIQVSSIKWVNKDRFDSGEFEISFDGWVFPFYGTYQKPVEWVDELVEELQKMEGVQNVVLSKEPLNRNLNQAVTINTDKGKVSALPFSITLRVKDGKSK